MFQEKKSVELCTGFACHMPTDEPDNQFVIYESRIRSSLRPGAPNTTYSNQISSHILRSDEKARKLKRDKKDGGEQI